MKQTLSLPAEMAIRFGRSSNVFAVSSLADAVAKWEQFRDENGLGSSESPKVSVIDLATFKTVCTVSYNGRCWGNGGEEILP